MTKSLEKRVLDALGENKPKSAWERLIALFQADREAFFQLACEGPPPRKSGIRDLADLAGAIRSAIRETFEIVPTEGGANLTSFSGMKTLIPADLVPEVTGLLREIDGKTTATSSGKDYEGAEVSEAEVRFKVGERSSWAADRAEVEVEQNTKPIVLQLAPEELEHLATQPPYVIYELLNCARRTVLAPTCVFKGLKRGDDAPLTVNKGWAFCGKPRQAYGNDGSAFPAPPGMVHMVYADEHGFVFDWDWVRENPNEPGYPLDWQMRFDEPVKLSGEAVLELPGDLRSGQFDATKACYSIRGDCIFCYMTDAVSYADRINPDLTVFKQIDDAHVTGFKIKNVRRILQVDQSIVITDAPELTVSVDAVLLATFKRNPGEDVLFYTVLIRALHKNVGEAPRVRVPPMLSGAG